MNKKTNLDLVPNKKIDTLRNVFGVNCNFDVFGFEKKLNMFQN